MAETEVFRQAWELYLMDAVFYNRVNLAVAAAEQRHTKFFGRRLERHELNAMKTAAAVALVLAGDDDG